ncbi:hypothetical protein ILUMI_00095 [Ignelater luminosus]|uniref:Uncharacterized protein n=1 Tax=Ignelater luminosus TaxID=2038154 RepID=A0A8K0DHY8_IGNLU|nr:hypothetical protein ILUMI_00095 [Ignelater luminosus]
MTQDNYSQQLTDLSAINLSFNETGKKDLYNILEDCYKQLGTFHEFALCSKDPLSKKTECLTGLLAIQRNLLKLTKLVLKPNSEDNCDLNDIISNTIKEQFPVLNEKLSPSFAQITSIPISKSNIIGKSNNLNANKYKAIIYPKDNININTSGETKRTLFQLNPKSLNIKPDKVIKVKNKGVLIESSDPQLENIIHNEKLNEAGLFAKLPEKQWPKLIFYNIPNNVTENEFIDHVSDNIKNELPV